VSGSAIVVSSTPSAGTVLFYVWFFFLDTSKIEFLIFFVRYLPIPAPLIDKIYAVMASKGHKRKRSIQDSPVDLSKMKMAMNHLVSLKEELDGIQETEGEMDAVMEHVHALQKILENAKKPRLNFSSTTKKDLENLGVTGKDFDFIPEGIDKLLSKSNAPDIVDEFKSLLVRLNEIYDHVNMDFEAGSRMILDAVLLSIAKISAKRDASRAVAILPEMRLGTGDGVMISHPTSKYEVWLTGNVDYGVVQYQASTANKVRMLGEDATRHRALNLAAGRIFLVEAKRLSDTTSSLSQHMPEAVSQALALSELANQETIRFCLSNGRSWVFAFLKKEADGRRAYYEAPPCYLTKQTIVELQNADSLHSVQVIVELVLEWLIPSDLSFSNELYKELSIS